MAIYSLNRRPILKGERTCRLRACRERPGGPDAECWRCGGSGVWIPQRPGFAAAHARYMLRDGACGAIVARLPEFVPETRAGVAAWLRAVEDRTRKNGRIGERIMTVIPRELEQRAERVALVRKFYDRLTGGAVPYVAGIHDLEGDWDNPHAHGFVVDRSFESDRVVIGFGKIYHGEELTTEWIRRVWEEVANEALAEAGTYLSIDRRSHRRRGDWETEPVRHRGPKGFTPLRPEQSSPMLPPLV